MINSINKKSSYNHHETDLKESLKYLPRNIDTDTLCKALKAVYDEEGYEIAKEWITVTSKNTLPNNFKEYWKDCSLTSYQKLNIDQFLKDNIYNIAEQIGWTPEALQDGKELEHPPSEEKRKEVERALEAPKRLENGLKLLDEQNKSGKSKAEKYHPVYNQDGACYCITKNKKQDDDEKLTKIVDCEVRILEAIEYITKFPGRKADEKEVHYKIELNNKKGKRTVSEVTHKELTTENRFSSFLVSKGFIKFRGESNHFDLFHEFLLDDSKYVTIRQLSSWGEYEPGKFLFENGLYDTAKKTFFPADEQIRIKQDNFLIVCPSGTEQVLPPRLRDIQEDTSSFLSEKFLVWEELNGQLNVRVTIGYAIACIYSRQILEELGGFPFLFKFGVKGTGKSTAMDWFMALFGYRNGNRQSASKQNTIKSIIRRLTLPISYPFFLDDYRNHETNNQSLNLDSFFLNWYHRIGAAMAKKSTDHQTIETPMRASIVMTGNDKPTDDAALSRMIVLDYNKHLKKDKLKRVQEIADNTHRFSEFTYLVLENYNDLRDYFFSALSFNQSFLNDQGFEGRTSNNWAIPLAGIETIQFIIPELSHWSEEIEGLRNEICDLIRRQEAINKEFNPVHEFFNALEYHATQKYDPEANSLDKQFLLDHRHFRIKEHEVVEGASGDIVYSGPVLAFYIKNCWNAMQGVRAQITQEVTFQQVMTHLEKSSYFLDKSVQTNLTRSLTDLKEQNRRCHTLNVNELLEKGFLTELIDKAREYERERPKRLQS